MEIGKLGAAGWATTKIQQLRKIAIGFTLDNILLYHPRALAPGLTVPLTAYFKS